MAFKGIPYFWGAIATTKCIRAIAFAFLPGKNGIMPSWMLALAGSGIWGDFMKTGLIHLRWRRS